MCNLATPPPITSLEKAPYVLLSNNFKNILVKKITEAPKSIVSCSLQARGAIGRWCVTLCVKENEELCVL